MSEHKKYKPTDTEIVAVNEIMSGGQRIASDIRAAHHIQERDWYRESHPADLNDVSTERRVPTPEEARRMDATLRRLGELFHESGLHWLLKGALNISLLRGAYIGVHKDVDVGIDVDELPELERVLASRGYAFFRSYYRGGKKGEGGVKVLERVSVAEFAKERGGELGKPVIAAIDAEGKIKKGEPLNFFEVFPIEHDSQGHLIGRMGATLPDEWKQPHMVNFQGVPLALSHPAMVAYFKMFNTRPYDRKDVAMLAETGVVTPHDVATIERVITTEAEVVTQKRIKEAEVLIEFIVSLVAPDMSADALYHHLAQIPAVTKRLERIDRELKLVCADIVKSDRSSESTRKIVYTILDPERRGNEIFENAQNFRTMVLDREKKKELDSNLQAEIKPNSIEQLRKELEELRAQKKMSEEEILSVIERLNIKILSKLLSGIGKDSKRGPSERLMEGKMDLFSKILKRVSETVGDSGSFEFFERATKILTTEWKEVYNDPDCPYFDVEKQKIYLGPSATSMLINPDVLILELTAKGSSGAANTLHHEFIHSYQFRKAQTIKEKFLEVLRILRKKRYTLLHEIHAYIGADRRGHGKRLDIDEMRRVLSGKLYRSISTKEDKHRLEPAAIEIKQLYALGLSDESIGELVSNATWDKKTETYDTLAAEVGKIMQDRNLSGKEVADLVKIDELKTWIRIEKIRIAAKDVITDFLK
ncbi:MAG: hypothetical protein Q7S16_03105 [bacterium]|nr:hypothetical protein [bacterium]